MKPPSPPPAVSSSPQRPPTAPGTPSGTTPVTSGGSTPPPATPAKWWLFPGVGVAVCALLWFGGWAAQHSLQPPTIGPFPGSGASATMPQNAGSGTLPSSVMPQPAAPGSALPPAQSPVTGASSLPAATGQAVTVQVAGRVASPGLYRLPAGSRVNDAVLQAGGALADGNADALNLAALVRDGEKIEVPSRNAGVSAPSPGNSQDGGAGTGSNASSAQALEELRNNPVNLNTATAEQLDALPGIGPSIAQRILDYRAFRGRFQRVDELGEVSGIGPRKLDAVRPFVTVQ